MLKKSIPGFYGFGGVVAGTAEGIPQHLGGNKESMSEIIVPTLDVSCLFLFIFVVHRMRTIFRKTVDVRPDVRPGKIRTERNQGYDGTIR